jgi:hypothetical protein
VINLTTEMNLITRASQRLPRTPQRRLGVVVAIWFAMFAAAAFLIWARIVIDGL